MAAGLLGVPFACTLAPPGVQAAAANCKLTLDSGRASPASGTIATQMTFSVDVSWKANCAAPDAVTLTIQGLSGTIQLSGGGTSTAQGTTRAVYSVQHTIGTPGSWGYQFAA